MFLQTIYGHDHVTANVFAPRASLRDSPRSRMSGPVCNEPRPCPCRAGSQYFLRKAFGVLWVGTKGLQDGVGSSKVPRLAPGRVGLSLGGSDRHFFLRISTQVVFVCSAAVTKRHRPGCLKQQGLIATVQEARSPRSRCRQGWLLLSLSPSIDNCPLPMSSHGHPSGPVCVLITSSYKDVSRFRLRPSRMISFNLTHLFKVPSPNTVAF